MKKLIGLLVVLCLMLSTFAALAEDARPVLIQGAMDVESKQMMEAVENPVEIQINGYHFVTGTLDGYPVVISKTQIGMVNAALVTALAVQTYQPLCVINQGTAGGHDPALHQGDIVIGETTYNINSFKNEHRDEGAGMAPESWIWRPTETYLNGEWVENDALHSDAELVKIAQTVPYAAGKVVPGVIGSGDVWNKEIDRINQIHAAFNTSCEEMETYAVAQVCQQLNVPFLGLRVLSNSELHDEDFDPATALACQTYAVDVAKAIIAAQK